jgi:hypothetical protein
LVTPNKFPNVWCVRSMITFACGFCIEITFHLIP